MKNGRKFEEKSEKVHLRGFASVKYWNEWFQVQSIGVSLRVDHRVQYEKYDTVR